MGRSLPRLVAIGTVVVEIEWSLVNHVILQDLMIKASCDFSDRSPSKQIIILPSLVTIGTLAVEI